MVTWSIDLYILITSRSSAAKLTFQSRGSPTLTHTGLGNVGIRRVSMLLIICWLTLSSDTAAYPFVDGPGELFRLTIPIRI